MTDTNMKERKDEIDRQMDGHHFNIRDGKVRLRKKGGEVVMRV